MGKKVTLILIAFLFLYPCYGKNKMIDKTVVKNFDVKKYLGTWYEIARYNHKFEKGLVGVTATYSLQDNGKIKVINRGYKNSLNGKFSQAFGKAKIPDPVNNPAKLKVSFFLFFYADYFVLELDKDYQWAVVGSSSDKYLWILSRTPQLDEQTYNDILKKIAQRGYNTANLIKVKQK